MSTGKGGVTAEELVGVEEAKDGYDLSMFFYV